MLIPDSRMNHSKTISIIPARGGSKGLLRKNIHPFAGKPLIAHSIRQSVEAESVDATFVSTDDAEIARVAREYGAEVISRPDGLSGDTASSESALLHALDHLERELQIKPELLVFLQCTSPLRTSADIDGAIATLWHKEADSLLSATISHRFYWRDEDAGPVSLNYDYRKRPRRQEFGLQYVENGSIYVTKPAILRECSNRLGGKLAIYPMEPWQSHEIDDLDDLEMCEWLYKKYMPSRVAHLAADNIRLIVYDFDGVMTDNRVYVDQNGTEQVSVNRSDGLAISAMRRQGIPQIILSTETNPVVRKRAEKLGIPVIHGVENKKATLDAYLGEHHLDYEHVVYVGNDVNDLEVMKVVAFPVAPSDAQAEVKGVAKITTKARGGEGVIRELYDLLNE